MFTAGILEEMFSGAGFEYLYFDPTESYAFGLEMFRVVKRDYDLHFAHKDYETNTGFLNFIIELWNNTF